jgi:excisionase family DNA binding protein
MTSQATRTAATLTEPISLQEAASRLGVHYMTAYRYVRTGRLPARRDGAQWLVDPHDLDLIQHQGDQHSLPGAIISDLLRGEGFEVIDLGANTPASSFAETAKDTARLVVVVIGVTGPGRDRAAQDIVEALRSSGSTVPVLIGGAAVNDAGHARRLGADAWTGPDGRSVIAAVNAAADRRCPDPPGQARTGR